MEQYKRAQVIMLPTNEKSHIYHTKVNNILGYVTGKVESDLEQFPNQTNTQNQHLYIISDDKIKKGDWYINLKYNKIIHKKDALPLKDNCKKIIATTDTSLTKDKRIYISGLMDKPNLLPQPSQQFINKYIESYNKGCPIIDILVEYNEFLRWDNSTSARYVELEINPKDNTITIKKLKDNFNLNEIEKALFNTKLLTINEFNDIWKVMKKNLG